MNRPSRKYPLASVVAVSFALIVTEAWILQRSRLSAARAFTSLEQRKQERDWLARQSPALSPENEAAMDADMAAAVRLLAELRPALHGQEPDPLVSPPPARSIDAFFDLASFVEKLRARAGQAQVELKPDERFGFATHAHEGPAMEATAAVHRQRVAAQYLVETLLESHPLALLAVRRERPLMAGSRDQRARQDDFFELPATLALRQLGVIEGEAFRLEFTGETEALRNFLNSLATFRRPIVVRSVEVEPFAGPNLAAPTRITGSPIPLVTQRVSKFVVTVEYILQQSLPGTVAL
jgi:hypothetical protein